MKKLLPVLLGIMLVLSIAVAADVTPAEIPVETDKSFDVSYTGTAGAYYALVVVEGEYTADQTPSITEDSIQYIDQKTADSSGNVSFENVLIKDDDTRSTVYLGGSDLSEALLLGWINEVDKFTVSGTVTSASTAEATVTITNNSDATEIYTTTTNAAGAYEVAVPAGTYTFSVTKALHLSYTELSFAVSADVANKNAKLNGGDLNNDNKVEFSDLLGVLTNFNTTNSSANINGDDKVDFSDLLIVLTNYNLTSVEK